MMLHSREMPHELCFHRETNTVSEKCGRRYFSYRSSFVRRFGLFVIYFVKGANRNVMFSSLSKRFSKRHTMLKHCVISEIEPKILFSLVNSSFARKHL